MAIGRRLKTEEDRAREEQKEREKRRKKLLHATYGKKKLKHARQGISSLQKGIAVLLLLIGMIWYSISKEGNINVLFGVLGLAVILLSVIGFREGFLGLKERNKNYITCKWGIALNGICLFSLLALFIRGLLA